MLLSCTDFYGVAAAFDVQLVGSNFLATGDPLWAVGRLQERVKTRPENMWEDPYPKADAHLYALVSPDWSREKCLELAREGLVPSKTKAATHGQFHTASELAQILAQVRFPQVEIKRTSGYCASSAESSREGEL